MLQAAGYQKKGCKNTVVDKITPEDQDKTNNFLRASLCPWLVFVKADREHFHSEARIPHGGFGVGLFECLNMNG